MLRHLSLVLLAAACGLAACRSSDKKDEGSQVKSDEQSGEPAAAPAGTEGEPVAAKGEPKAGAGECAQRPEPTICCEALSPSCNECRDKAKQELDAWKAKCLKPAEQPKDCSAGPPLSECNADGSEASRQCREAAIQILVEWKERCSDIEAHPCDKQPPQSACCQAMIPSCTSCRDRNRRIQEDWARRCN